MADAIGNKAAHNYYLDTPPLDTGFFAKGLGNTDWGMKNRLSRIFDPKSGNTVMLAFDHGYIMGATGQAPGRLSSRWFSQYSGRQYEKALYWRAHAERVWDCNGLAEGYYADKTGKRVNVRARDNYAAWCGAKGRGLIPPERRVPGAAVFWGTSAAKITHVAFLTRPVDEARPEGDWHMVEARGVLYGVVNTRLLARRPSWWGWMDRYFEYGDPDEGATLTVTGSSVRLREGPGTSYAIAETVKKGARLVPAVPDSWTPVLRGGRCLWIKSDYVKPDTA